MLPRPWLKPVTVMVAGFCNFSHRLSGIIDADEVYIMATGKIVQSGECDKLAGEKGWYKIFIQLEDLGWRYDG